MSMLRRDEVNALIRERASSCVSIYLPTHRSIPSAYQDPLRFKNLLGAAEDKLISNGLRPAEAADLLAPARVLLADSEFWQYQSDGLAVFVSPASFRFFTLPITFEELCVVAPRFHLKPLMKGLTHDGSFYVLSLSQNKVKFYQGTGSGLSELFPDGIPDNLEEALRYDDPQRQLQFHTRTAQSGGRRAAVFHGHGVGIDDNKDRLLRYCREIDDALRPLLSGEAAPLVLACVDYLMPIYREANSYPHLMDEGIPGNPELLSATDLHEQAWRLVSPTFTTARLEAMARYRELAGTGRTSSNLSEVIQAAAGGRIESVFVTVGLRRWGKVDSSGKVSGLRDEPEPGDEDLLDRAVVETLSKGGAIFAVDLGMLPDGADLCAIFRY
jgi:hypothetical protein